MANKTLHSAEIIIRKNGTNSPTADGVGKQELNDGEFGLFMHYPRQLFRTAVFYRDHWHSNKSSSSPIAEVTFNINNMEVSGTAVINV